MRFESIEEAELIGLVLRIVLPCLWLILLIISWNRNKSILDSLWHLFYNAQFLRFISLVDCSQSDYILEFWRNINQSFRQYAIRSAELGTFHENFEKTGVNSPIFLDNTLVLFSLFVLYELFLSFCYKKLKDDQKKLENHILSAMIKGVLIVYYDFWIFAVLQVYTAKRESLYELVNLSLATAILVFLLGFLVLCCLLVGKHTPLCQGSETKYTDCLTREFRLEAANSGYYIYYLIFMSTRAIVGTILVLLWEFPEIQNFILVLSQLTTCMFMLIIRPFRDNFQNSIGAAIDIIGLLLIFCNMAYSYEALTENTTFLNAMNGAIFLVIVILCLTKFGICFFRHYASANNSYDSNKQNKRNQTRYLPSIDEGAENKKHRNSSIFNFYNAYAMRQLNESCRSPTLSCSTEEQVLSLNDECKSTQFYPNFLKSKRNAGPNCS